MSGHSKWHSIKHQKAASDAKKGAVFTRMARNITMAAKQGGGDPATNFKLRLAIDQAKAANVPKENVERAIKRGTGEGQEAQLQENFYEGYGPKGVAIIIKTITDNTNRTVSDLRHALTKNGGSLAESGSVLWNFEFKGVIRIETSGNNKDEMSLYAIEVGAEDIIDEEEGLTIKTDIKNLQKTKQALESMGAKIATAGIEYIAKNKVDLDEDGKRKLENLTDDLDNLEDISDYFTNDA